MKAVLLAIFLGLVSTPVLASEEKKALPSEPRYKEVCKETKEKKKVCKKIKIHKKLEGKEVPKK